MAFVCLFPPSKSADAWDITLQLAPDLVQFALDSIFLFDFAKLEEERCLNENLPHVEREET